MYTGFPLQKKILKDTATWTFSSGFLIPCLLFRFPPPNDSSIPPPLLVVGVGGVLVIEEVKHNLQNASPTRSTVRRRTERGLGGRRDTYTSHTLDCCSQEYYILHEHRASKRKRRRRRSSIHTRGYSHLGSHAPRDCFGGSVGCVQSPLGGHGLSGVKYSLHCSFSFRVF